MHIAWIGKKSPFCGNVTYGREITNALLDRGYRVTFLHFATDAESEGEHVGYEEVSLPFIFKSQILIIPSFRSARRLAEVLAELKPDLVHASLSLSPLDFKLPEICHEQGIPLVATFHPAFDRKRRNLTSGTQHFTYQLYAPRLANYDQVIVFSRMQQELLVKLGVPAERVAVIPNGVDIYRYAPGHSRIKQEFRADQIYVYQGRLAIEKNVESLLKGWKLANMRGKNKLIIVGSGPLEMALKTAYGADTSVIWLGFVADENRRIEILQGADAFILPSLIEGLSLSLLEAMACGAACIATDAGADGEVLENGAGIVIDTQRVAQQLQTILPLLRNHPEMLSILSSKARQRVLDRYTLSQNITQLENLYARMVPSKARYYIPKQVSRI
ncbi:glycosyltransferase family 1 protein [Leptolyngbyaceae cyanobacterium CCMR0082]|uniref:Glycosyltransferase family 1 protein n=2 Tax=Adonisia turfae TaxID=2950184 RepID=A0A6M0S8X0_9CYAN|nr:glycosyltransferase family 4 protein [Adonisia turfae]MDV3347625.1 glycosyltransferase family 4 protein [Leptothoe sp. LEGE 181152]NEZ55777.1 glycosyltransferase family 1 protein [Adonisia turfae CCMR0081]NEZ64421.1 glycosyltransferase family 1 protein [Adonisia turfae CCMR0082]